MYFKTKYGKLLASFFIASVLLVCLNFNCFAAGEGTYSFSGFSMNCLATNPSTSHQDDVTLECTIDYGRAGFSTMLDRYVTTVRYPVAYNTWSKMLQISVPLSFQVGCEYNIKFDYTANYASRSTFIFVVQVLASSDNSVIDTVGLYNGRVGSGYAVNSVNCSFSVPYYQQAFYCLFYCHITADGSQNSNVGQAFFFTDMIVSVVDEYGTFNPPSGTSGVSDGVNNTSSDIADLDSYDIDSTALANALDVDMSQFNDGMIAVKSVVEQVLEACSFMPILTFSLAFGICIYMLGRRLA